MKYPKISIIKLVSETGCYRSIMLYEGESFISPDYAWEIRWQKVEREEGGPATVFAGDDFMDISASTASMTIVGTRYTRDKKEEL